MTGPFSASNDDVEVLACPQSAYIPRDTRNGNISVSVRLCPMPEGAGGPGENLDAGAWSIENVGGEMESLIQTGCIRKVEGRTVFHFDQVFDEKTHTPLVYQSIARPMVPAVLNGKHATIFAYGQTGSGKTFTMQGGNKIKSGQAGVIQLVAADLFRFMRKDETSNREYEVKVSYFEIYNEKIRDLLAEDVESTSSDSTSPSAKRNDRIYVRTNARGEIVVNVEQKKVNNTDEAMMMLVQGNARRTVAATDMNAHSSRSHSIFRLTVESRRVDEQHSKDNKDRGILRVSDFNLVDLAGSESLKTTRTTGIRQREGATINQSLLALTTVIQALSQPIKKKTQHINFRDSKLTRILQPHLSGNAKLAILCCASRSNNLTEETRSTLKFASRAKLVQTKPKINEVMDDDAIIRKLKNELYKVRKQLEFSEKKTQKELAEGPIIIDSAFNVQKATDTSENEALAPTSRSKLDTVDSVVVSNAVQRCKSESLDSFDPKFLNSSQDSTANSSSECDRPNEKRNSLPSMQKLIGGSQLKVESHDLPESTESDSSDGPGANCSDVSLNICSQVSNPETIRGIHGEDYRGKSIFRYQDSEAFSPNGRSVSNLSWDAMASSIKSLDQTGQPVRAIQSINDTRHFIPDEITIIESMMTTGNNKCLTDCLKDSEARIEFLEEKLELSDILIEASVRDLHRARHCIRDLVQRNVEMSIKLRKKGKEDTKKNYEKGEIMVEQYWILKLSLYSSVFFFLSGSQEYFLATAFFVWLALEMNVTA